MDWTGIIKFLGGSTLLLGAIGWVCKSAVSHFLGRDLARLQGEIRAANDRELESLKKRQQEELLKLQGAQARVLADLQAAATENIERVKAALLRMERLESELLKSRGKAYGEIWKLTHSVNLFGPTMSADDAKLSAQLRDWYFSHGWALTVDAKRRYFLVQEVLNYFHMRGISFRRPADEQLFGRSARPIEVLREFRARELQIEARGDDANYSIGELEACVSAWKSRHGANGRGETNPEHAWVLLQFVMSAFRSCMVEELGSRSNVQHLTAAGGEDT